MKKLLLIRHAKATHESGYTDFERPLTERGIADARAVADRLNQKGIIPQLFVSSPALRTHSTANIFTDTLKVNPSTLIKAIYDAGDITLMRIINGLPAENDFIALVGHNPAIGNMMHTLSGELNDVPPGTVALIEFDLDSWAEIHEDAGKLTYYDNPKA